MVSASSSTLTVGFLSSTFFTGHESDTQKRPATKVAPAAALAWPSDGHRLAAEVIARKMCSSAGR